MKNDGGPAFPKFQPHQNVCVCQACASGMSLRDWFAGMALSSGKTLWGKIGEIYDEQRIAFEMYSIADAMIKEREKEMK